LTSKLDQITKALSAARGQKGPGLFGGVDKFMGLLYEHWPLPRELRDFCEALRKVAREWGPYLPGPALESLGEKVLPHFMQSLTAAPVGPPPSPDSAESISDEPARLERLSRIVANLEAEPENLAFLSTLDALPAGAILRWKEGETWKKITSSEAQALPCSRFRGAEGEADLAGVPQGFIEIESGELSYYLTAQRACAPR
jgi:hypothetical protein